MNKEDDEIVDLELERIGRQTKSTQRFIAKTQALLDKAGVKSETSESKEEKPAVVTDEKIKDTTGS